MEITVKDRDDRPSLIIPALAAVYASLSKLSYPMVRFVAGAFLIPHGWPKLFGGVAEGTAQFFASQGLEPALPLVYLVGITEVFGGLCLALGLLTRPAAAAVTVLMTVSAFQIHWPNGFAWINGGFEYPLFWGVVALAILFKGGGRWSVDRLIGREF